MSFKTGLISFLLFIAIAGICYVLLFIWGIKANTTYSREAEIMALNTPLVRILKTDMPSQVDINNIIDRYSYSVIITDMDNTVITSNLDSKQDNRTSLGEQKIIAKKDIQGPVFIENPLNNEMVKRVGKVYYEPFNIAPESTNMQFNILFSVGLGFLFALLFVIQATQVENASKTGKIEEFGEHIEWHEDETEFLLEHEEKKAKKDISAALSEKMQKINGVNREVALITGKKNEEIHKMEQQIGEYKNKINKLLKELAEKNEKVAELNNSLKNAHLLIGELKQRKTTPLSGEEDPKQKEDLKQKEVEIKSLKQTIQELAEKLEQQASKDDSKNVQELANDFINAKAEIATLKRDLEATVYAQAGAKKESDKGKTVIENLQKELAKKQEYINSLPKDAGSMQEKMEKFISEKQDKIQEIGRLSLELADIRSELVNARSKLNSKTGELEKAEISLNETRSHNKRLEEELLNSREVIKKQSEILSALPEEPDKIVKTWEKIKTQEVKSVELEKDLTELKKESQTKEEYIKKLTGNIDSLKAKIDEKELLFENLPKKSKQAAKEIEKGLKEIKDREIEINNLNNLLNNSQNQIDYLQNQIDYQQKETEKKITNLEKSMEQRAMENITLKEQEHSYLKQINELNKQLEMFKHKEEQFARAEEIQHQIKNLQTSLELLHKDKEEAIKDKEYMETELDKARHNIKQIKMERDEKTKVLISVSKGFDSARQVVGILTKEREALKGKIAYLSSLLNNRKNENG